MGVGIRMFLRDIFASSELAIAATVSIVETVQVKGTYVE